MQTGRPRVDPPDYSDEQALRDIYAYMVRHPDHWVSINTALRAEQNIFFTPPKEKIIQARLMAGGMVTQGVGNNGNFMELFKLTDSAVVGMTDHQGLDGYLNHLKAEKESQRAILSHVHNENYTGNVNQMDVSGSGNTFGHQANDSSKTLEKEKRESLIKGILVGAGGAVLAEFIIRWFLK